MSRELNVELCLVWTAAVTQPTQHFRALLSLCVTARGPRQFEEAETSFQGGAVDVVSRVLKMLNSGTRPVSCTG